MQLLDTQKVQLTFTPGNDANGFPGTPPSDLSWSVDNGSVVVLTVAADNLSVEVAAGVLGTARVTAASASDPNVNATFDIEVIAGPAVSGTITPGDPVAK